MIEKTNNQIAESLGLSQKTTSSYKNWLIEKVMRKKRNRSL